MKKRESLLTLWRDGEWERISHRCFALLASFFIAEERIKQYRDRLILYINPRKRVRTFFYWTGVVALGVTFSIVIMHVAGIELAQPHIVSATTSVLSEGVQFNDKGWGIGDSIQGSAIWLLSIFFQMILSPILIGLVLVTKIFEIVVTYPFGSSWGDHSQAFVNVPAVATSWKLVRDVCNVFFAMILVIIALCTVLKIEAYSWKQLLPRLVLMAVLINFSRSIAGVFTDFATVVMATFGGGFSSGVSNAAGHPGIASTLLGAFQVFELSAIFPSVTDESSLADIGATVGFGDLFFAYFLAGLFAWIALTVIVMFTVMLMFRIVMLWFLIVLSPIAYLARVLPVSQRYSSQWWEMFGRYVASGPLIAFFMWLSLSFAFGTTAKDEGGPNVSSVSLMPSPSDSGRYIEQQTSSTVARPEFIGRFAVAIFTMIASQKLISQMAPEAGKLTGQAETGAWAAGGALLGAVPQWLQRRKPSDLSFMGSGVVGKTAEKLYTPLSHLAVVAGTLAQPIEVVKNLKEGLNRYSVQRKRDASAAATQRISDLRQRDVFAPGLSRWGSMKGMFANATGIVGMMGTEPETFIKNYASPFGLWQRGTKFFEMGKLAATGNSLDALNKKQQAAEKEKIDHRERLTKEEHDIFIREHDQLVSEERFHNRVANEVGKNNFDVGNIDVKTALDGLSRELIEEEAKARASGDTSAIAAVKEKRGKLESIMSGKVDNDVLKNAMLASGLEIPRFNELVKNAGEDKTVLADSVMQSLREAEQEQRAKGNKSNADAILDQRRQLERRLGGHFGEKDIKSLLVGDATTVSAHYATLRDGIQKQAKARANTIAKNREGIDKRLIKTGYTFNVESNELLKKDRAAYAKKEADGRSALGAVASGNMNLGNETIAAGLQPMLTSMRQEEETARQAKNDELAQSIRQRRTEIESKISSGGTIDENEMRHILFEQYLDKMELAAEVAKDRTKARAVRTHRKNLKSEFALGHTMGDASIKSIMSTAGFPGDAAYDKIKDKVTRLLQSDVDTAATEGHDLQTRIDGKELDGVKGAVVMHKGTNFTDDDQRKIANSEYYKAGHHFTAVKSKMAALEVGESFEARVAEQQLVAEEFKKVGDLLNSNEVKHYYHQAKREGNRYLVLAALKRITQLADENEILQDDMAVDASGKIDPLATTDAVGLENFRRKVLIKEMGMTDEASQRYMNDISFMGEQAGHLGIGRKYQKEFGKWKVKCDPIEAKERIPDPNNPGSEMTNPLYNSRCKGNEQERINNLANEQLKRSSGAFVDINRLGWGYEDHNREFHVNELTRQIAQRAGGDLAESRLWDRISPNAKWKLSQPDVIKQFQEWGVHPNFILRLQDYYQTTGRFVEGDQTFLRTDAMRMGGLSKQDQNVLQGTDKFSSSRKN